MSRKRSPEFSFTDEDVSWEEEAFPSPTPQALQESEWQEDDWGVDEEESQPPPASARVDDTPGSDQDAWLDDSTWLADTAGPAEDGPFGNRVRPSGGLLLQLLRAKQLTGASRPALIVIVVAIFLGGLALLHAGQRVTQTDPAPNHVHEDPGPHKPSIIGQTPTTPVGNPPARSSQSASAPHLSLPARRHRPRRAPRRRVRHTPRAKGSTRPTRTSRARDVSASTGSAPTQSTATQSPPNGYATPAQTIETTAPAPSSPHTEPRPSNTQSSEFNFEQ